MNKVGCPKGYKQSPEHIAKRVAKIRGKKRSPESIERYKISNKGRNLGRKMSLEQKMRYSELFKRENNPNWQGGKKKENARIRASIQYRLWRQAVIDRDGEKCTVCGDEEGPFQVDHIKPFAYYPDLRFDVDNGRVICLSCHRETDTFFYKGRRLKETMI